MISAGPGARGAVFAGRPPEFNAIQAVPPVGVDARQRRPLMFRQCR
jgi:hypothetical protein